MGERKRKRLRFRLLPSSPATPRGSGRFLAITGIGPTEIRSAAREPGFLGGVLEYIASDDRLVAAFAGEMRLDPVVIDKGRAALAGDHWERDVP